MTDSSSDSTRCPVCGSAGTAPAFAAEDLALRSVPGRFGYRRCGACGSVYAAPQPDERTLAAAYPSAYENYQTLPAVVERLASPLTLPEARRFIRHADAGGRLIELGAGNGRFLERLRRCGWWGPIEGVEFDQAAAAATSARTGFPVRCADLNEEILPEQAYEAIVMRHVIEHLRRPAAILEMVFAALRPGGLLFIGTPDARALSAKVFGRHWWGYEVPRHLVVFSDPALRSTVARAGFESVDRWSGFSPLMWSASLGLLLSDRQAPGWLRRVASSPANPLTMAAFGVASALEVAVGRSTMLCLVARRPAAAR
jgi:SAM-dependent methyltransferase